jgi:hypothetical protein
VNCVSFRNAWTGSGMAQGTCAGLALHILFMYSDGRTAEMLIPLLLALEDTDICQCIHPARAESHLENVIIR